MQRNAASLLTSVRLVEIPKDVTDTEAEQLLGDGTLYRLDPDLSVRPVLTNLSISNGIGWSPSGPGAGRALMSWPRARERERPSTGRCLHVTV